MPSRTQLAHAIRALSMDAVQKARSGHPGMPMGMADIAEVLWNDYLKHNPNDSTWCDRDRFILSNGHGCMLHYALLHLSGYPLTIEDLTHFRQLGSATPGHPEFGITVGVEATTGPLGQGLVNAVGMAIAERTMAKHFNRGELDIVNHYSYVFTGDGCLMEGISHEACSLAGTLGLNKLIVFYDDNGISIDGQVQKWFTDDTPKRFESYGWHVIPEVDGHNPESIIAAIEAARKSPQPSLLCCKTIIGYGSPAQGGESVHGAPLGEEAIAQARKTLDWHYSPFEIPHEIREAWDARSQGHLEQSRWQEKFDAYQSQYPELASEFKRRIRGTLPDNWQSHTQQWIEQNHKQKKALATREASRQTLASYNQQLPELIGGSADLAGSNGTLWEDMHAIDSEQHDGNYIYFGVREFAMSAIANGISLHNGFIPFAATFLVFSDYARNALRLSAMMKRKVIFIYTHDSIGLGEDGPTHQPIEHLNSLRLIPNLDVWRPCDSVETAVAWKAAIEAEDHPTALILSRQSLAHCERTDEQLQFIHKGAYLLRKTPSPVLTIIATGSEVALAAQLCDRLAEYPINLVSMPCAEAFDKQPQAYKETVLPDAVPRLVIEAGNRDWWYRYVGTNGAIIGINSYGASAPGKDLFEYFGFNVEKIYATAKTLIDRHHRSNND